MLGAIDMRTELTTLFTQFSYTGQREDLKTATVGEDRFLPSVETVQATSLTEHLKSGSEIQMIGVAKDNLGLHLLAKLFKMHTLDSATRTYRHKYRGFYLAVVGGYDTRTGITVCICML